MCVVNKRWVFKTSRNRFAYPTDIEALEELVQRKLTQIACINGQLKRIDPLLRREGAHVVQEILFVP
ncbi:MAG: hypothetical protein HOJ58_00105 [Chloroflexi bacterium]|jgi:hypothetical protein|nr:hypothetical protein [Chloroflexota bacterium]